MPRAGDVIAGKYVIDQLIGVGGMGAVFAALHQFTGKRVALKWMLPELAQDPDAVQRFMREAHAAGRINHPNVVDVYDVGQHEQSYFLVMEYLHGEPLTAVMARRELPAPDMVALLLPAMRGVAAAHRQGVVHRDLKPDNIFLAYEEDGMRREPKVLDFGISKVSSEGNLDPRLTRTGAVVGTPYYMSPEQIRGSSQLDKRADIYAFGVILYEALTGRVPFHAETYGALVLEIATGTPPALHELVPAIPPDLSSVVLRAMARDAEQRYPTMEHLIAALEPYAAGMTGRHELRDSSRSQPQLLATTVGNQPPGLGTQVSTVPYLASTPFAAEASSQEFERKRSVRLGIGLFVAAAVVVVVSVWYATRPAETVADHVPIVRAPEIPVVQPPIPTSQPPVSVPPVAPTAVVPTVPSEPPHTAGELENHFRVREDAARRTRSEEESEAHHRSSSRSSFRASHRRGGKAELSPGEAELPPAETSEPVEPSEPTHRARSGTLNVDEF